MAARADSLDLARLRLTSGEGRRLELEVALDPLRYGGETYAVRPPATVATLDVSRTTHSGYALRLRFEASLAGPCQRCLQDAAPALSVDAREIDLPGEVEELRSPYVDAEVLDLRGWARDALALALPAQLLCRADCAGLCPVCGVDLNAAAPGHAHERGPDPRWAKLSQIRFE